MIAYTSYEDLKVDTKEELIRIMKKLNIEIPKGNKLVEAVENQSFQKKREYLARASNKNIPRGKEFNVRFLRKGTVGDYKRFLSEPMLKYVKFKQDKALLKNKIDNKIRNKIKMYSSVIKWFLHGRSVPLPYSIKRKMLKRVIKTYVRKYNINVFIETGTFYGDTTWAMRKFFKKIYSIELSEYLFRKSKERFEKFNNIEILHGDSSKVLPKVLSQINEPALFWLDGHYSGGVTVKGDKESPILEELEVIFSCNLEHILLIDDARLFDGTSDYPTIETLEKCILSKYKNSVILIKDDIIKVELKK